MKFEVGDRAKLLNYEGKETGEIVAINGTKQFGDTLFYVVGTKDRPLIDWVVESYLEELSPLEKLL